jgi:O-antigen ligase
MISCGIIFLFVRPKHMWKMFFAGVAGVTTFIFIYLEKIIFLLRLKSGLSGRGQIWSYSLYLIEKSPFLGVGFLNIGEEFYKRFGPAYIIDMMLFFERIKFTPMTDQIHFYSFHAHNLFLNLAVEMGVFAALGALILYILMIFRILLFIRREKLNRWEKLMAVGILGIVTGSFVHSFFDTNTMHYIFMHFVILLALERMYLVRLLQRD